VIQVLSRREPHRAVVPSGIAGVVDVIVFNRWGLQNPSGTQLEVT
jgi:hypothetical protein